MTYKPDPLDQGEIWTDRQGHEWKISEMSERHRWNAAAMLTRGADRQALRYTINHPLPDPEYTGELAYSSLERDEVYRLSNPEQWMGETRLFQALVEGLSETARINAVLGIPVGKS